MTRSTMTGAEAKTLREFLSISAQGWADRLKHTGLLSSGNLRTIQRWEQGERSVPQDIAEALEAEVQGVQQRVDAEFKRMQAAHKAAKSARPFALIRYDSQEDFQRHHPGEASPHGYRLHVAAISQVFMRAQNAALPVRMVMMDLPDYEAWRFQKGLEEDLETRQQWAEEKLK